MKSIRSQEARKWTDSKELDRPLGDLHFWGAHAPRVLVTAPRRHELGLNLEATKPGWDDQGWQSSVTA